MSQYQVGGQNIDESGQEVYQSTGLLLNEAAATVHELTASNSLVLLQVADTGIIELTASPQSQNDYQVEDYLIGDSSVTFVYQVGGQFVIEEIINPNILYLTHSHVMEHDTSNRFATQVLVLTQLAEAGVVRNLTASNTLILTQLAESNILTRTGYSSLELTQFTHYAADFDITASSALSLTQSAESNILTRTAYNSLELVQDVMGFVVQADAIALTAESMLTFVQTNNRVHVLAAGDTLTASHTLVFTQHAIFPIELSGQNTVVFTQSASADAFSKTATSLLELEHLATVILSRNFTATSTLNLRQAFTWTQFRDGVPVIGVGGCNATRRYSPFSAGGTSPIRPVPPVLSHQSDVLFFYPVGPICGAISSITLRAPEFGDRDRNQYDRINRESRGGSLKVFRDPDWPKERILAMNFTGISDNDVDDIIEFLEDTLGQRVGLRDWHNRVWFGLIVTPDSPVVRNGRCRNDLSLEMQVESTYLDVNACNVLSLSQMDETVVEV